jgi:hypothetical protein
MYVPWLRIAILEPLVNFQVFPSELLDGTPELYVRADSILMLIFEPLNGMMHIIYR